MDLHMDTRTLEMIAALVAIVLMFRGMFRRWNRP